MRKVFRQNIVLVTEGRLFLLLVIGCNLYLDYGVIRDLYFLKDPGYYISHFARIGMPAFIVVFFAMGVYVELYFWHLCFGKLVFTDEDVTLRCLFMKTRRLTKMQCQYVGIDSFTEGNVVPDYHNTGFRYIYFSTKPYPTEYHGRINKLKNTDTFFQFMFSQKLCDFLAEWLPAPQNRLFLGLAEEEMRKKNKQKRKKEERKRKKEAQKRKKEAQKRKKEAQNSKWL